MPQFAVIRLPFISEKGEPVAMPADRWQVRADLRSGRLQVQGVGHHRTLDLREVLAVEVGEEKEVTAVGATIGRMALTGLGAALFSQGRRGGIGAGLLDLSARGSVKRSAAAGIMVWPDTTVIRFTVQGQEIDQLLQVVPEETFSQEHLDEARSRLDLLERMRSDGRRALDEMAREVAQISAVVRDLHVQAEQGSSFIERDAARQDALELQDKLVTMRILCTALQADLGVHTRELMSAAPNYPAALPPPQLLAAAAEEVVVPPRPAAAPSTSSGGGWTKEQWSGLAGTIVILWFVLHNWLKVF